MLHQSSNSAHKPVWMGLPVVGQVIMTSKAVSDSRTECMLGAISGEAAARRQWVDAPARGLTTAPGRADGG
jgi:hypothetical protein